jgi:small conductance mechanosensitive channel
MKSLLRSVLLVSALFYAAMLPANADTAQPHSSAIESDLLNDAFYTQLTLQSTKIDSLTTSAANTAERSNDVATIRLLDAYSSNIDFIINTLQKIAEQQTQHPASPPSEKIAALFSQLKVSIDRFDAISLKFTKSYQDDLPPAEQAVEDAKLASRWQVLEQNRENSLQALQLAEQFGLDVKPEREHVRVKMVDQAQSLAVALTLTMNEVEIYRHSVSVIPGNEALISKLSIAENRVIILADRLSAIINIADQLGIDKAEYEAQLLLATGQISSDIFNPKVILSLLDNTLKGVGNVIADNGPTLLLRSLLFLLFLYLAIKAAQITKRITARTLASAKVPLSNLLQKMIISISGNTVLIIGILIALAQIGISLGPVLAGLGIVGFVIGFALQDSMSNFASGMLILMYRPFDVDDVIETGGVLGKVKQMSLVNTTIRSYDNQTFVIPNNIIWQGIIKNLTEQKIRRVDLIFGISYSDDIPKTEQILNDILEKDNCVLAEPEPVVRVHELGDSSVNFVVRPWVKTEDYWETYWRLTKTVKMRFDEEAVSIPFPQRDVHMIPQST